MEYRKIIHVDMDAFFASVEQLNNPDLKGKPVIVGGPPDSRGVVAACSYEARKYGIHSAMPSKTAYRLCPHAVFIRGRYEDYVSISRVIRDIFLQYTDLIEPLSLDEAYLDVTVNKKGIPSATAIAKELRKNIVSETGLTASAGVSYNKFLAKVASDYKKPDGLTVITPDIADTFIDRLPIGKFFGIGKVTEKKMKKLGIKTGSDLKRMREDDLLRLFGKVGGYYYSIAHGRDNRPVEPYRIRKSVGKEVTLSEDTDDLSFILGKLKGLTSRVADILESKNMRGRTITLKVKFHDFTLITRSITIPGAIDDRDIIFMHLTSLIKKTEAGAKMVRLVGLSVSNFEDDEYEDYEKQLPLPFLP